VQAAPSDCSFAQVSSGQAVPCCRVLLPSPAPIPTRSTSPPSGKGGKTGILGRTQEGQSYVQAQGAVRRILPADARSQFPTTQTTLHPHLLLRHLRGTGGGGYGGRGYGGRRQRAGDSDEDADLEGIDRESAEGEEEGDNGGEREEGRGGEGGEEKGEGGEGEEEVDPLDAFMMGIQEEVKRRTLKRSKGSHPSADQNPNKGPGVSNGTSTGAGTGTGAGAGKRGRGEEGEEDEDEGEGEGQGAGRGKGTRGADPGSRRRRSCRVFLLARQRNPSMMAAHEALKAGYGSDEEVYATARAVDAAYAAASGAGGRGRRSMTRTIDPDPASWRGREKIDLLAPVDHSQVDDPPLEKRLTRSPRLPAPAQPLSWRRTAAQLAVRVTGYDVPRPVRSFQAASLDPAPAGSHKSKATQDPTPIQAVAIPVVLSGRDVIGMAKTGSEEKQQHSSYPCCLTFKPRGSTALAPASAGGARRRVGRGRWGWF